MKQDKQNLPEKLRKITIIILVVGFGLIALAAIISHAKSDSYTSSNTGGREWGNCIVCGKRTTLQIDGLHYCKKHYNQMLFG